MSQPGFHLFASLNRARLAELAPHALVVLPLGATEQHGPHLATGMDFLTVERLCRGAAAQAGRDIPIVVAPVLPFGSSHHHLIFGATLSLSTETYLQVLKELLDCLVTDGFRRLFVVNGHGGNQDLMQLAARDTALRHPVSVASGSYWQIARQELAAVYDRPFFPGHAGDFETSLMLAQHPELVDPAADHSTPRGGLDTLARQTPYREEHSGFWKAIDGYSDDPREADPARGRQYMEVIEGALAAAFVRFHGSSL